MNHVVLLGEVIATPATKRTANDKQVCTFSVRIQPYKEEDSPWELAVCAWGQTADHASRDVLPGAMLVLQGNLRLDKGRPPELQLNRLHGVASPKGLQWRSSVNSVCLVGRAGRDPEARYFESGAMVVNLTLAVNRLRRDDDPDWFNLAIWGKQAEVAVDYVRKGSQLGIIGSLGLERWTDRASGEERSKPVVRVDRLELLNSKRDSEAAAPADEEVPF